MEHREGVAGLRGCGGLEQAMSGGLCMGSATHHRDET